MSNRKRYPQPAGRAARRRRGHGRHRQPPRHLGALAGAPAQAGAKILAAGALGSAAVVALPIGAASAASLTSAATGGGPAVSLTADILPGPTMYYKAPPAAGTAAPAVPLPVPRPADAPGPPPAEQATTPPASGSPSSTQPSAPQDQFGAGAQPIQMFDITPTASAPPPQGHSVGVSVTGYSPTSGLGGTFAVAADGNAASLTLGVGFGVGGDVKVAVGPPVATGFQAGVYAQASDSLLGAPKQVPTPLGDIQNPGGKVSVSVPIVNVDSSGNVTFPDVADSSGTLQLNLKPSDFQYSITGKPFAGGTGSAPGPDLTTQGSTGGGLTEAGAYKVADFGSSSGVGLYFRVGASWQTLGDIVTEAGKAQYTIDTGRSFDEDFPPSPQEVINQGFASFPTTPQVGLMPAPEPAPGAQPVPYLSIGNSGGPVDPITGAPASYGTTQGSGSLPSWAVPGLVPAPSGGSGGTGQQGALDPAPGTDVAANAPADTAQGSGAQASAAAAVTQASGADTTQVAGSDTTQVAAAAQQNSAPQDNSPQMVTMADPTGPATG